jgi:2-methylisocitrate lyase-like PEP mutase family enzyme
MPSTAEKRRTFRELHKSGCFAIPNPWDIGTTRRLQALGFKALATSSAAAAWSLGYADRELPLEQMLEHIRSIAAATDLPVNADFTNAFADDPGGVADNVARCLATGVAGLSVEDQIPGTRRLYDLDHAVARIKAARRAFDEAGDGAVLVARSEVYIAGHAEPLEEAIRRLNAFAEAGADCLFAPGISARDDIAALVEAVAPMPVNVVVRGSELKLSDLAALGVRRVSTGGWLGRIAWAGFERAASDLADGRFDTWANGFPGAELDKFFSADVKNRQT